MRTHILSIFLLFAASGTGAQQFAGTSGLYQPGVSQVPFNPAWVTSANSGLEINLFAASAMAGTNAYVFNTDWMSGGMSGGAAEGKDYQRNFRSRKNRHMWGNIDVIGPSIAIPYRNNASIGIYTRFRQIVRGGNIDPKSFLLIGGIDPSASFPDTFRFDKAGFSTHVFGELGFSYGKVLSNDYYNIWKGGVTIKYLSGMAAGSLYSPATELVMNTPDSLNVLKGDITALYSENIEPFIDNDFSNDFSSWFDKGGKGGIGFDIGVQYEYHPAGDPNQETPYLFRISASITDIGSIGYKADTTGGIYSLNARNRHYQQLIKKEEESFQSYYDRLAADSIAIRKDSLTDFRMGLPTALRLNGDVNIGGAFWMAANILLNMRGDNGDAYRPAYVSMLNVTPRFENKWVMVGVPFTFWGYESLSAGLSLRAGPLFLGSTSLFSSLLGKNIRNLDAYAGLSFRLAKQERAGRYFHAR